ncbi:Phosphate acetyltransferase [Rhodoplanes serenus]|jgi:phosphate butyryltransferase|uniref:Phosphate acetyltransferase n=1 Tax=Rhodoplanes serenus TaxID=200615 RepID=A0A447CRR1_9BRAD|nr:bifunctional enoyl-CoA hydratase/phosphate acetyltransferase [Rhodoplanes serenus]MBI5114323.1 bifunctional enoyl-CoA hydratase/phosphate acetyltransferase [Rhodovulum sp.]VCU07913.1 Phosphate acetyltransferase [Rhodoplanes serenus]
MKGSSVRNTTWDELEVGASAFLERTCTAQDMYLFAHVSGNLNPITLPSGDDPGAKGEPVAPSLWVGSLVSAVLGNLLPGPGSVYRAQSFNFVERVRVGSRLRIEVKCIEKREKPLALFETTVREADGHLVVQGIAEVDAPLTTIVTEAHNLPTIILDDHEHFAPLIAAAKRLPPLPTAVLGPDDRHALGGTVLSAEEGLIVPILIGDGGRIRAAAKDLGVDIGRFEMIDVGDDREASKRAVDLVNTGRAAAIMKGNVGAGPMLAAVMKRDGGLRTGRKLSHAFVLDVPTLEQLLFITDCAINIAPDLSTKVDIVQNGIDLARACGIETPRVGVLSAVETVNPNIPSTLDAAALSKMAERGQIKGGIVDGPLAMDNAMDVTAARTKGITSLVAGRAEVLIVPNLESGNMLAKELTFVARAESAGLVVGARVPIILTSRADNDRARLVSCALAQLYIHWSRTGRSACALPDVSRAAE